MKPWRTITILGFALSLLLTACLPSQTVTPISPTPSTDAKISQPTDGATVSQTETIKGTSQRVPDTSAIWVVVYIPSVGRYYPQNNPADIQANGNWSSVAYIGIPTDVGLKLDIIVVMADKTAQDAFNAYLKNARDKNDYPGLEQLPKGAKIYDRITVTRK